jgi:transcriptional regulator with XRE-family HTH domain
MPPAKVPPLSIGKTLALARMKKGDSQRVLAEKMGVDRSYISRVETTETENITLTALIRFGLALEIPASRLLKHAEKSAGLWGEEKKNVED